MRTAIVAYCLGIYLVSLLPELSEAWLQILLACWLSLLLLACYSGHKLPLVFCAGLAIGIGWHWHWGSGRLVEQLNPAQEGIDLRVAGTVVGIPTSDARGQRFALRIEHGAGLSAGSKLQLSYFADNVNGDQEAHPFRPGDRWQLTVRLKQVHGYANPGQSDREAYLFRNGFIASGYVRGAIGSSPAAETSGKADNVLVGYSRCSISVLRHSLLQKLESRLSETRHPELIIALILGEKDGLGSAQWDLFSATGTNHLFVISGLHIGMLSLAVFQIASYGLRLLPRTLNPVPAQSGAALLAIGAALAYSVLAGWSLPTQRASIMVAILLANAITGRQTSRSYRFVVALAAVMTLDPLASSSPGFWLSFTAVGVLLFFGQSAPAQEPVAGDSYLLKLLKRQASQLIRPQWLVFVGLFLPLVLLFGSVSLIAPLANVLAIPMLGFLLLPVLLLACLLLPIDETLSLHMMTVGDLLLHVLISTLELLATEFSQFYLQPPPLFLLVSIVPGIILLLMPAGVPFRWLAFPLLIAAVTTRTQELNQGFQVRVFDVGQGLAVLVRTAGHALLFDTGPAFGPDWNAGAGIVLPALRHLGVHQLDSVVVSHGDSDHAGGLEAIRAAFPAARIIGSVSGENYMAPCVEGNRWQWDGVHFMFLHPEKTLPDAPTNLSSNNRSCVLRINFGNSSILLPGDIEAPIERQLAASIGGDLRSTVLLAPHHGSNTSSSYPFIKMVDPQLVIYSAGYGNGFGHPAPEVVQRYLTLGIKQSNTAHRGMISIVMSEPEGSLRLRDYRGEHRRYWSWSGNPLDCRYC